MQNVNINEGRNLTLLCNVSGIPPPMVSWIKVGGDTITNEHELVFTNITRTQAGEYKCEASNLCGNASETATIEVQRKWIIVSDSSVMLLGIQLFRQRLSQKNRKAYATMPIGIMGRKSLVLIDWGSRCLPTRKEKAWVHLFALFPSLLLKHLKLPESLKQGPWTPTTHDTFRHCRVRFCWTTFLETAV